MDPVQRAQHIEALFAGLEVRCYVAQAQYERIEELRPDERSSLEPMVSARQAEFATARACARAAMADWGIDASVPRTDGGAPLWPDGITGSISHTKGFCAGAAALQLQPQDRAIGIDMELIDRMKPAVERRILVDAERAQLHELSASDRRRQVATIFAAKEAFYKAHYEIDARYLGFDTVAVEQQGNSLLFSQGSGAVHSDILAVTCGRVLIDQGRVVVGVTIDATSLSLPLRSPA